MTCIIKTFRRLILADESMSMNQIPPTGAILYSLSSVLLFFQATQMFPLRVVLVSLFPSLRFPVDTSCPFLAIPLRSTLSLRNIRQSVKV